jgi:hypothetical protein
MVNVEVGRGIKRWLLRLAIVRHVGIWLSQFFLGQWLGLTRFVFA